MRYFIVLQLKGLFGEVFLIWIERLKTEGVVFCTDWDASWGKSWYWAKLRAQKLSCDWWHKGLEVKELFSCMWEGFFFCLSTLKCQTGFFCRAWFSVENNAGENVTKMCWKCPVYWLCIDKDKPLTCPFYTAHDDLLKWSGGGGRGLFPLWGSSRFSSSTKSASVLKEWAGEAARHYRAVRFSLKSSEQQLAANHKQKKSSWKCLYCSDNMRSRWDYPPRNRDKWLLLPRSIVYELSGTSPLFLLEQRQANEGSSLQCYYTLSE